MATETNSDRRLCYSLDEVTKLVGVGRDCLYGLIRRNELRTVKIGGRRMVPAPELYRLTGTNTETQP